MLKVFSCPTQTTPCASGWRETFVASNTQPVLTVQILHLKPSPWQEGLQPLEVLLGPHVPPTGSPSHVPPTPMTPPLSLALRWSVWTEYVVKCSTQQQLQTPHQVSLSTATQNHSTSTFIQTAWRVAPVLQSQATEDFVWTLFSNLARQVLVKDILRW